MILKMAEYEARLVVYCNYEKRTRNGLANAIHKGKFERKDDFCFNAYA